jgi:nitroimidazol reductase NimA-like FMN-containing flavoprotein (pyridoxamine 5'-phosphate oxidase superfamily)
MTLLTPDDAATDVRELSELRCRELLEVATVGRIGFVSAGLVEIIPVSFRAVAGVIHLRTRPGSQVNQLAEAGRAVAFEVDYHAPDLGLAWSVLMQGRLETVDAAARRPVDGRRLRVHSWVGDSASRELPFVPRTYAGRSVTRTAA